MAGPHPGEPGLAPVLLPEPDVLPALSSSVGPPVGEFEAAFEAIRRRAETRTRMLEEALEAVERTPHRFWGINE